MRVAHTGLLECALKVVTPPLFAQGTMIVRVRDCLANKLLAASWGSTDRERWKRVELVVDSNVLVSVWRVDRFTIY